MHKTEILFGEAVREVDPDPRWTAVARCDCGWYALSTHGQQAELEAQQHLEEASVEA